MLVVLISLATHMPGRVKIVSRVYWRF